MIYINWIGLARFLNWTGTIEDLRRLVLPEDER